MEVRQAAEKRGADLEFEQDYIMRMIKGETAALARIIFRKTSPQYELPEENKYTVADDLYGRLLRMADAGAINKAENMLYQEMDQADQTYLEMGIGFYDHINEYEDEFLAKNDYTRTEINEGIKQLLGEYGMDSLDEFLEI